MAKSKTAPNAERNAITALARNRLKVARVGQAAEARLNLLGELFQDMWDRGDALGVEVEAACRPILEARERMFDLAFSCARAARGVSANNTPQQAAIITALSRGHSARSAAALTQSRTNVKGEKAIAGERTANRIAKRRSAETQLPRLIADFTRIIDFSHRPENRERLGGDLWESVIATATDVRTVLQKHLASPDETTADEAAAQLRRLLSGGQRPMKEVQAEVVRITGASARTIQRARAAAGVEAVHVRGANGRVARVDLRLTTAPRPTSHQRPLK